jgi:Co/Zn/Cd efflux system component
VSSLTRQEPPRASALPSGWPVRRAPRWVVLAIAGLLVVAVAVALVHKPSQAERASDMRGLLQEVSSDIASCAGGVGESLTAMREAEAETPRSSADLSAAINIAQQAGANCAPANNELIDDLESYQVPESLDSFGLKAAVSSLVDWAAPRAQQVETAVAGVLAATTPQAKAAAQAALTRSLAALDAQRAKADGPIVAAIRALGMHASPPRLPL